MAAQHPHSPSRFAAVAVPAFIPFAAADTNVSVGVVGLVLAILLLFAILLALVVVAVAGEHRANLRNGRHYG
jgi:hypothetical protein